MAFALESGYKMFTLNRMVDGRKKVRYGIQLIYHVMGRKEAQLVSQTVTVNQIIVFCIEWSNAL